MRSRWFHRPIFHLPVEHPEKRVSWLELFYDLIFVAALIQLGNGLSRHVTVMGFIDFSALFATLWIVWTGLTNYANRYTVDDFLHRSLVFLQMFAIGSMAVTAPEVMDGYPYRFAISYALAQILIGLLYLRSGFQQHTGRSYGVFWGGVYSLSALIWFGSLWVAEPFVYGVWALGMLVVLLAPFVHMSRGLTRIYPADMEHLGERYGLMTLIVLGESFVKVLSGLSDTVSSVTTIVQAMFILVITCSIWWIYFDDVPGSMLRRRRMAPMLWRYGHLPLQLAITATGVGIKKAVEFSLFVSPPVAYAWLLVVSLALVFAAVALIDLVTVRQKTELSVKARVIVRLLSATVLFMLGLFSQSMVAIVFLVLILGLCLGQVAVDMLMAPFKPTQGGDAGALSLS